MDQLVEKIGFDTIKLTIKLYIIFYINYVDVTPVLASCYCTFLTQ